VRVVPRASANEIVGVQGEALKVRLTAPPVEGRANQALVKFLARALNLRPGQIRVVSGHTGRTKTIAVTGVENRELATRLEALLKRGA
jgi:hypothetical protein